MKTVFIMTLVVTHMAANAACNVLPKSSEGMNRGQKQLAEFLLCIGKFEC